MTEPEPREELFSALGVTISPDLLIQALTHRSFSHEHPGTSNYERLEFLGDAVLELVSTETLFTLHPDMTEGQLAKMRAKAVSEEALSAIARDKLHGRPVHPARARRGGVRRCREKLHSVRHRRIADRRHVPGARHRRRAQGRAPAHRRHVGGSGHPKDQPSDWKTSLTVKAHELGLDEPRYRMSVSAPNTRRNSPPRPPSARKTTSSARVPAPASARRSSPRRKWPGMSSTGTRPRSRRPARTARPSTGAAARPATDQLVNGDCAMLSPVCLN